MFQKILLAAGVFAAAIAPVGACTTICFKDAEARVYAQNYDWDTGVGQVIINKRGLKKSAFGQQKPAAWTAKFGSVTFNQYGLDFPISGMNEKGLVIATMWLDETAYAAPDERPSINMVQWIQYQLDTNDSVAGVLSTLDGIRIAPYAPGIGLHYLVGDAAGNAAAIEVLGGKVVVHAGAELDSPALTNNTYESSMEFLKKHEGFGGTEPVNQTAVDSLSRFARASARAKEFKGSTADESRAYAFESLSKVKNPDRTQWSAVFDQKALTVSWRTRSAEAIRSIKMADLDFSCAAPRGERDVNAAEAPFQPVTAENNAALVKEAFAGTPRAGLNKAPAEMYMAVAKYPFGQVCE